MVETMKPDTEPDTQEQTVLRCEAAAVALEQLVLDNTSYLESGERQAPSKLYDAMEDLVEVVAEAPQDPWPNKSWEFLEHVVSIAKITEENKANWRSCSPHFHQRLVFFLQRAADQIPNLLDSTPPEDVVCDLETIEECLEQKLTDDQIARLYEWYTPDGRPDRKKVKLAKKGKVKTPETVTHSARIYGPQRQPHLGDLDSCLSLFAQN